MTEGVDGDARRRVSSAYAAEADGYRELWAPVLNPVSLELLGELPQARHVLDMATGVGTLLPCLRQRLSARRIVGLDLVPEMISLADPAFGRAVGDVARLPFADAIFDVAVVCFVLFHLPRPQEAVVEAFRVLRPGGVVGTLTWESDSGGAAREVWDAELVRHGAPEVDKRSWHELVDTPDKVGRLLEGAGFADVRAWTLERKDEPTRDEFVQRRLRLGQGRSRLELIDPETRATCIARATERLQQMRPEDFTATWRFVLATARRPS